MTINDLLNTREYRGNQSLLARELGINRGTFIRYMSDTEGKHHFIVKDGDKSEFFANMTNKINKGK